MSLVGRARVYTAVIKSFFARCMSFLYNLVFKVLKLFGELS